MNNQPDFRQCRPQVAQQSTSKAKQYMKKSNSLRFLGNSHLLQLAAAAGIMGLSSSAFAALIITPTFTANFNANFGATRGRRTGCLD